MSCGVLACSAQKDPKMLRSQCAMHRHAGQSWVPRSTSSRNRVSPVATAWSRIAAYLEVVLAEFEA